MEGSIALVSPKEGNFNAYNRNRGKSSQKREYRKLPHGRVSMNEESVRLTLNIGLDETGICSSQILVEESEMASRYAYGLITENENVKTEIYERKCESKEKSVFRELVTHLQIRQAKAVAEAHQAEASPFSDFTLANGGER